MTGTRLTHLIAIATLCVVACSSFDGSGSAPAGTDATVDAGADSSMPTVVGQPRATPDAPSGLSLAAVPVVATVSNFAGSGAKAFGDGPKDTASFSGPEGVALDASGKVYVVDTLNTRIRVISAAGIVSSIAGSGSPGYAEGTGAAASFHFPHAAAIVGNDIIYVSDTFNLRMRKLTSTGVVTLLAGSGEIGNANGLGSAAGFASPNGVALDGDGNIYVADSMNNVIRSIAPAGLVSDLAGANSAAGGFADGAGTSAMFSFPDGVAWSARAGCLYVADFFNNRIRKVTRAGVVTTVAGSGATGSADGESTSATFEKPRGMAVDGAGNIYVSDSGNNRIRRVTPHGTVSTLAGSGAAGNASGVGSAASFAALEGLAADEKGTIYVADSGNNRIRKIDVTGVGQLQAAWHPPTSSGSSPIGSYLATATAPGEPSKTCTAQPGTGCTLSGLTSRVLYSVSVIATNASGASEPSSAVSATPN